MENIHLPSYAYDEYPGVDNFKGRGRKRRKARKLKRSTPSSSITAQARVARSPTTSIYGKSSVPVFTGKKPIQKSTTKRRKGIFGGFAKSRKAAKREAKGLGMSGEEKRKFIRLKTQENAVKRIAERAEKAKTPKKAARLIKKAKRVQELGGKSRGGQFIKKAASVTILLPFAPLMKKALRKQGDNPPSKLSDLTQVFYDKVVKKSGSNFSNLEQTAINSETYDNHFIDDVVEVVVSFFGKLAQRKKNGEKLSPVEEVIATQTIQVEAKVMEAAEAEVASTLGATLMEPKTLGLIGVGLAVFIGIIIAVIKFK